MSVLTCGHIVVVCAVVSTHVGLLWLLQTGLQKRPTEVVVVAQMVAQRVPAPPPPLPVLAPTRPTLALKPATNTTRSAPAAPLKAQRPAPVPVPAPSPKPLALQAPAAAIAPMPVPSQMQAAPAPPAVTAPMTAAYDSGSDPPMAYPTTLRVSAARATPGQPTTAEEVKIPPSAARHLHNPPPRYPPLSRRLGEQGEVILRVRIEANGSASQANVYTSSGYARLDQAALASVLRWRFVPGTRNGQPEAMWFTIPIQFVLE